MTLVRIPNDVVLGCILHQLGLPPHHYKNSEKIEPDMHASTIVFNFFDAQVGQNCHEMMAMSFESVEEAKEVAALYAIEFLKHHYDLDIYDYNKIELLELRARTENVNVECECEKLVAKIRKSKRSFRRMEKAMLEVNRITGKAIMKKKYF
ncbi:uncharacterized protein LOC126655211 [Mercurialis annua]|uniref:uncharacterized protein LOC126655211 n=1 Tax=Mercurialis annua TaxID=3986 RepID=UPI002160E99C|nr:uncharacterized protein LOC126655211 [Mercurialis annua]XP_050205225.1 uncharacterized protein LOC126655211 [Mercurialis annua]XP_050224559.1 uncharacterized protein LOC126674193 [Mercurialis annua]XP_055962435.1 uncharacterized protein LOC126655211 [Mercurialis annua]